MSRIAIQGAKGIGKDMFYSIIKDFIPSIERFSAGDILKKQSLVKDDSIVGYDFNYLLNDFKKVKYEQDILEQIYAFNSQEDNHTINNILQKKYDTLDSSEKLFLIEKFKNIGELSTRQSLQMFSDHIKEITRDSFYFADRLGIEINNSGKTDAAVTDLRYISEVISLLEDDFIPIKLVNRDNDDRFGEGLYEGGKQPLFMQHVSETELGLSKEHIGLVVDITGTGEKLNAGKIRYLPKEVIKDKIKNEVLPVLQNFNGYSDSLKSSLVEMREKISKDHSILNLQNEYSFLYSKRNELDSNGVEKLRNAYLAYQEVTRPYIKALKTLVDNELININNNISISNDLSSVKDNRPNELKISSDINNVKKEVLHSKERLNKKFA